MKKKKRMRPSITSNLLNLTILEINLETYVNGVKKITANSRGLFNFEHIKTDKEDHIQRKSESGQDNIEWWGRWGERWKENWLDTKLKGPQDVSLDFTFEDAEFVFGLPEHATGLQLSVYFTNSSLI